MFADATGSFLFVAIVYILVQNQLCKEELESEWCPKATIQKHTHGWVSWYLKIHLLLQNNMHAHTQILNEFYYTVSVKSSRDSEVYKLLTLTKFMFCHFCFAPASSRGGKERHDQYFIQPRLTGTSLFLSFYLLITIRHVEDTWARYRILRAHFQVHAWRAKRCYRRHNRAPTTSTSTRLVLELRGGCARFLIKAHLP